jgi:hypothetical protein
VYAPLAAQRGMDAAASTILFSCSLGRYRRRLHRLLVEAAPPLAFAADENALPSPLLLRRAVPQVAFVVSWSFVVFRTFTRRQQDQLGQLKGSEPPRHSETQQQQNESKQQPSVQHKLQLQFEGIMPSPNSRARSPTSRIKRRPRQPHHQRAAPVASSPRSPPPSQRQHLIDSLLSLAMMSIKQQPTPPFSTLVQGGPAGFRSPRRHQVSSACCCGCSHS